MRGLGDPRRIVVADPWRKRDPLPVRGKPFDAMAPETVHGVREEGEAFEKRECDDRLIDVEFEMALRTGERDRRLVAENPWSAPRPG